MILKLLKLILEILRVIVNRGAPPKPGPLKLVHTREDAANMAQVYTAAVAPKTANDVVSHEVTLTGATFLEGDAAVQTIPEGTATTGEFKAEDGVEFSTSYVQIDDAGNRSESIVQTFTAVDDIAPGQPGELGLTHVREE